MHTPYTSSSAVPLDRTPQQKLFDDLHVFIQEEIEKFIASKNGLFGPFVRLFTLDFKLPLAYELLAEMSKLKEASTHRPTDKIITAAQLIDSVTAINIRHSYDDLVRFNYGSLEDCLYPIRKRIATLTLEHTEIWPSPFIFEKTQAAFKSVEVTHSRITSMTHGNDHPLM